MGCCCPKAKDQDEIGNADERTRLLSGDQKSRFLDPSMTSSSSQLPQNSAQNNGSFNPNQGGFINPIVSDINADYQYISNQQNSNQAQASTNLQSQNLSESNQMFEKILSEVIHVSSAFDQRITGLGGAGYPSNDLIQFASNMNTSQVQEMPFKIKGILEPPTINKQQQLALPEGVPIPFSVLAAQPPFTNDIRLINTVAHEAYNCINNFSLNVPDNVAFDFKPVLL